MLFAGTPTKKKKPPPPKGQAAGVGTASGPAAVPRKKTTKKPPPKPPTRRPPPPPPRASAPARSSSSSGAAPRSAPAPARASAPVERVTPPPKPPSIKEWLAGDEVYQQGLRGGRRSLADFMSDIGRRRGEAETQFGLTTGTMEEDRTRQLERMRDEFAARGLIHSGLFGKEQGRFQEQFQKAMQQLETQQANLMQDFLGQERDFRREQDQAQEIARLEALQRRASRFNIPL
jgi:hypothetical protein